MDVSKSNIHSFLCLLFGLMILIKKIHMKKWYNMKMMVILYQPMTMMVMNHNDGIKC